MLHPFLNNYWRYGHIFCASNASFNMTDLTVLYFVLSGQVDSRSQQLEVTAISTGFRVVTNKSDGGSK
jgi:hypothetical protein